MWLPRECSYGGWEATIEDILLACEIRLTLMEQLVDKKKIQNVSEVLHRPDVFQPSSVGTKK